ncbi:MAG: GNAT family N-acetyltransferase [Treponema sp.]|nr:GNAT family N-acetyltransferase [Treponema sp.]MBR4386996.1 GNAT family N-acetyltransferase [Treponema sp.]
MIKEIVEKEEKSKVARAVLESLTEWFEVEENREQYIKDCKDWITVASYDDEKPLGFLCLKETGRETVELAVMGVAKDFHRKGIGKALFLRARDIAVEKGYSFMQVKTVKMGVYEDYDRTNLFYKSLGFKEFEVMPLLWDEANPCQIYVMSISKN